ncbi:MAG: hypothetical protein RMH84_05905 [Sulfolobales archaeon]|nr:hypothetical protein [Sulfolobales archaeon]MCX8208274.1 hypothetical protein [Sulfolobales archaeon]MDW8011107.1 hypothetical protein [Sulfolobales archaeon]
MEEYLVSFEFPSAKTLISLLETVGEVTDEVLVKLNSSGLRIRALDPARLSLIELEAPSTAFTLYDVRTSELSVGVNLSALLKMLPRPRKADVLRFSADESFYKINIEGTTSKSFKLRSIEVQAEEIQELKLEFKVRAIILSNAFKQALSSLGGAGVIEIEVPSADYIVLRGGDSTVKLSRVAGSILDIEFKESAKSSYEESYISKITPLLGLTDNLEISLSSSSPLSMVFRIPGDILVRYVLAPRD